MTSVASAETRLQGISSRFESGMHEHRPLIDCVEKMSRGVQGINLRVGQDFEGGMDDLIEVVGAEIEWELADRAP